MDKIMITRDEFKNVIHKSIDTFTEAQMEVSDDPIVTLKHGLLISVFAAIVTNELFNKTKEEK